MLFIQQKFTDTESVRDMNRMRGSVPHLKGVSWGRRIGRWWRGCIQRDNVYKILVCEKYKSSVSESTGSSKMNKFRIAYITMKLPHTIKKILKTIRRKTDSLQRNDRDTARRCVNGSIRSLKTVSKSIFKLPRENESVSRNSLAKSLLKSKDKNKIFFYRDQKSLLLTNFLQT